VKGSLKAIAFFGLGNQKTGNCGRRKLDYHLKGVKGRKEEGLTDGPRGGPERSEDEGGDSGGLCCRRGR
jgi:hypothetical protein